MKQAESHDCLGCHQPFTAERRNAYHQKYCTAVSCRQASKAASQLRWLAKPENQKYHQGSLAVARVSAWQQSHPEYRARQKAKRTRALQDFYLPPPESPPTEEKPIILPPPETPVTKPLAGALQDLFGEQAIVFIGLISHLFGFALQDDIAKVIRVLQQLGEDITNGKPADEIHQAPHYPRTPTPHPGSIQLGRPSFGAG